MAEGDLIYKSAPSNLMAYKLGGNALAYSKDGVFGDVMSWTAGDLTRTNQDVEVAGAGTVLWQSPTTLDTFVSSPPGWYYRAWSIGGQLFQFSLRGGWVQINPAQGTGNSELRITNQVGTVTTRYQLAFTTPASPSKPAVGTYTWVSGLNLGTVTISA